jgi:type VI secretion system protein ImpM
MSVGAVSGGLFGKLPAHGDFVARGRPTLVARFERWLTTELAALAAVHGDGLDRLMAHAPVWRFVVNVDGATIAGILLPSTDRLSRLFPLVIFSESDATIAPALADALAVMPLDESMTADDVMIAIAAVMADQDGALAEAASWRSEGGDTFAGHGLPTGAGFARLFGVVDAAP